LANFFGEKKTFFANMKANRFFLSIKPVGWFDVKSTKADL
jgi:hypothetical protein